MSRGYISRKQSLASVEVGVQNTYDDFLFLLLSLLLLFLRLLFFLLFIFDGFEVEFELGLLGECLLVWLLLLGADHAGNDLLQLAISFRVEHSDVPLMASLVCHPSHLDAVVNLLLFDLCFPLISPRIRPALRRLGRLCRFLLPLIFVLVVIIAAYLLIACLLGVVVRRFLLETVQVTALRH